MPASRRDCRLTHFPDVSYLADAVVVTIYAECEYADILKQLGYLTTLDASTSTATTSLSREAWGRFKIAVRLLGGAPAWIT